MKYYRIALVAPMEYRDDDPVWTCFETLRLAGHAVEVIDPRRFADIIDENGTPNAAALAPFIARFAPDYLGDGHEGAEGILAKLAQTDRGSDEPARRFVVFGYVGPNNFGDELIFSLICREIERRFPRAHIQLIGHDPNATLHRHGIVSTTCERKLDADIMLRGASALVYMAGIMFDDAFEWWSAGPVDPFLNPRSELGGQAAFTLMATMNDVPAVYLGIGAGPLANPDGHRLVRIEARCGARYLPRDAETERLLLAAGVPAELVNRKADLAFTLERTEPTDAVRKTLESHNMEPGGYLAVSLRDHRTVPEGFADTMAQGLSAICRAHGLSCLFIDLSPEDTGLHRAIADRMDTDVARAAVDVSRDGETAVGLIDQARAVVAMRLHCSIVANAHGVQSIGLDYNEKIAAYYDLMDRTRYLLPMDCSAADLARVFAGLDTEREDDLARTEERAQSCRALATEAFDEFERIVREHKVPALEKRMLYPRSVSIEEERWHDAERERDEARADADRLRQELDRVRTSTTWRVGSAVTALPRALKRARDAKRCR